MRKEPSVPDDDSAARSDERHREQIFRARHAVSQFCYPPILWIELWAKLDFPFVPQQKGAAHKIGKSH
jgi:hypothetical protein